MPSVCQDYSSINIDTLNKYDKNGKKTGYWIEYLDEKLKIRKNASSASYLWFVYYLEGKRVSIKLSSFIKYSIFKKDYLYESNSVNGDSIIILNGTILAKLLSNNKVSQQFVFANGKLISIKEYNNNSGKIECYFEFTENPLQYYFSIFNENESLYAKYTYMFSKGNWKSYISNTSQ